MARKIPLTQGFVAIVDDDRFDLINRYRWKILKAGRNHRYAARSVARTGITLLMHRVIADAKPGQVVDHINDNGLDNRRCNLRICSQQKNSANARKTRRSTGSRFKGVSFQADRGMWLAQIVREKKHYFLGRYRREREAAYVYKMACQLMDGAFARLSGVTKPPNWSPPDVKAILKRCGWTPPV